MDNFEFWSQYGNAAKTALGFFWKSGWAFILGYSISSMIQTFVPKTKLTPYMGAANLQSISLATLFGAISSSCSFAALSTARSLVQKGAHFAAAIAFMFASTNLVIELGILILIFLGWQFLAAEIIGGIVLIILSTLLVQLTYPKHWIKRARDRANQGSNETEDFNWKERISSLAGWQMVGHTFVMEWKMVWKEILVGFTVAGFVTVFVPDEAWEILFLANQDSIPQWWLVLENALIAPFVAALTFIGSMGNIPLATVLHSSGVLFAGIMSFIYSDLIVPPLVRVNSKYYGWAPALYISVIMYVSMVITGILLYSIFSVFGILPDSGQAVSAITQFKLDYTFWLNLLFLIVASGLVWLHRGYVQSQSPTGEHCHHGSSSSRLKPEKAIAYGFIVILLIGLTALMVQAV
jgi:uncharacterized membrane protein YraQ (UPF0718 family)